MGSPHPCRVGALLRAILSLEASRRTPHDRCLYRAMGVSQIQTIPRAHAGGRYVRFGGAIRTCSPTGPWDQRPDDGSRMNREVHVRFWESAGLRCPAPLTFLKAYDAAIEPRRGIGKWLEFYDDEWPHQALDYRTPREIFEGGTCEHVDNASASLRCARALSTCSQAHQQ
jgi:hypothetical protein